MSLRRLPFALLLLTPFVVSAAHADEWVASTGSGCQVSAPNTVEGATYRWQGECAEGKAQGAGILTSSHGGLLQGEFKAGVPFNAHGFWPLQFKGGGTVNAQHTVTDGVVFWNALELPEAQGRATPGSTAPLAGEWEFLSGDGKCRERHTYHADGSYVSRSGEEVMEGAYAVMTIANAKQVLGFVKSAITANGKPDCAGQRAPLKPDSTRFFYLLQETPDRIAICRDSKSPLTCIGTYTRVVEQTPQK
jgi:hypothetical protein